MSTGIDDRPATRSRSGRRAVWLAVAVAIGCLLHTTVCELQFKRLLRASACQRCNHIDYIKS